MTTAVRVASCSLLYRALALAAMCVSLAACNGSTPAAASTYSLGGTISGLTGTGLVLASGSEKLTVSAGARTFAFSTKFATATPYAVTVQDTPSGLTCSVAAGSGTFAAASITDVVVTCSDQFYALGGSVSGLTAAGLVLVNGHDTVQVLAHASAFMLPTAVPFSSRYSVTVATQPTGLTCVVSNGSGPMPASNVTNVAVTCATTTYTLGGVVIAGTLTASGLVLANGTDRLTVAANASVFSMPTALAGGALFSVTIAAQPAGLVCTVANGTGTMPSAAFNGVQVTCTARAWAWEAGSNSVQTAAGSYGTRGVAAAGNAPSQRDSEMNWTDHSGRLWLFGGSDQALSPGDLDDLWMYDPATGLWTWVNGSSNGGDSGSYGSKGVAAAGNTPPSRHSGVTWVDSSGHLWLFGGFNDTNLAGSLNDLWMYDIGTNQWTWVGGMAVANDPGAAGTRGVAAAGNLPSSRVGATSWTDSAGHFWLYGGNIPAGGGLTANDLWMYDPISALWTWVTGSTAATGDVAAAYGTRGVAAAGNTPGARQGAAAWADHAGHLWLFGGSIYDSSVESGLFADLWSYDIASNLWTWVGGANSQNAVGINGSQGIAAVGNTPGGRTEPAFWTDQTGRLWLFGGGGYGPDASVGIGWLSDLWMFDPTTQQWTWVNGPADPSTNAGVYGTEGTAAPTNVPGGRVLPVSWVDSAGSFWMFGGYGADANASHFDLNDLWKF